MAMLVNNSYEIIKDTIDISNNKVIKKGTIIDGGIIGSMPNGEVRLTSSNGQIFNMNDLKLLKSNQLPIKAPINNSAITNETALQFYSNPNNIKRAVFRIASIGLLAYYCHYKKFSLLKSTMIIGIPIIGLEILSYTFKMGGKYQPFEFWTESLPPSIRPKKEIPKGSNELLIKQQ